MPITAEQITECDSLDEARIKHTVSRATGVSANDIEDVYQEAMLAAWKHKDKFRKGSNARPWLTSIAVNKAKDSRRKSFSRKETTVEELYDPPARDTGSLQLLIQSEQSDQVISTLLQCSPKHRRILTLVYLMGLTYQEAANLLNIPIGTIKSRVYQAKREFRGKWKSAE